MDDWLQSELEIIKQRHLQRTLQSFATGNDPHAIINGQPYLLFSSNNYLGLATDPRLKHKAIEAVEQFGVGSGGARLTTGNTVIHEQLEKEIASFKGTEASLVFSSGYLTNIGVIAGLMSEGDVIFSDALNHASIIDGCRLSKAKTIVYQHADMADLEEKLKQYPNANKKLIVTDGIFSMDGDIAPLPQIVQLAKTYDAYVMVDDAHATGVIGKNGGGTAAYFGLQADVHITVGTLSKAVGAEGGFVATSQLLVEYLRNKARTFIFQTSLSPAVIQAAREGIRLIQKENERQQQLERNGQFLRSGLKKAGFTLADSSTPIIAIIIGAAEKAVAFSEHVKKKGMFIPAIRPPTVQEGSSRLRMTVMATHTSEQLQYALETIIEIGKKLAVIQR